MTRLLPALHDGHAPIHLHRAFEDALEAYENWGLGEEEPSVDFDGRLVAISSVFGRMRSCSDLMPLRLLELSRDVVGAHAADLDDIGVSYAQVALVLRALSVERLRDDTI